MNVFLFVIFLVGKDGKIHLLCTVAILFNFVIVVSLHLFSFCMCFFVCASDCILITFALSISTITRDFVLHYEQIVLFFILFLRFCFLVITFHGATDKILGSNFSPYQCFFSLYCM